MYKWVVKYQGVVRDPTVVRYFPWHRSTCSALIVVTYQGVVRYLTHCPEHADTNSSKSMRHFWQTTHYTRPTNKPTCTLIRVFSSNNVLQALWPIRMEYSVTDPSRFVPLLESSFDFLEVFAIQCSTYVPNRWLHMYPMDGHVLSPVFISMDRWWYRRLSNWIPQTFLYYPLMHPYMEITCTTRPKTILHTCVFPIWEEKLKISRS